MDLWKDRSKHMNCGTCMWFAPKAGAKPEGIFGRCRRHAPTMSGFPAVYSRDWCGDHKLEEESAVRRLAAEDVETYPVEAL